MRRITNPCVQQQHFKMTGQKRRLNHRPGHQAIHKFAAQHVHKASLAMIIALSKTISVFKPPPIQITGRQQSQQAYSEMEGNRLNTQ